MKWLSFSDEAWRSGKRGNMTLRISLRDKKNWKIALRDKIIKITWKLFLNYLTNYNRSLIILWFFAKTFMDLGYLAVTAKFLLCTFSKCKHQIFQYPILAGECSFQFPKIIFELQNIQITDEVRVKQKDFCLTSFLEY